MCKGLSSGTYMLLFPQLHKNVFVSYAREIRMSRHIYLRSEIVQVNIALLLATVVSQTHWFIQGFSSSISFSLFIFVNELQ